MLSLSSGMSAGRASDYFKKEDYYVRGHENSQWLGSGAASLGLSGEVRETQFMALAEGIDPKSGKVLVKGKPAEKDGEEVRRAGNDATFSAPKSVSIAAAAGVEGVKDAHDQAVQTVMEHIEQHNQHVRINGKRVGASMVAAKIDHLTSREAEPQLHSHVFIFNMAKAEGDSRWRANEPSSLFKDKMALGMLYRNELYNQLAKQGFDLRITDRDKMYFELSGIEEKTIADFSTRRAQVEARVEQLKTAGQDKGLTHSQLYERAALNSRGSKKEYSKEELQAAWKEQSEKSGQSLEAIRENVRQQQLDRQVDPAGAGQAIKTALDRLTETEAVVKTNDVLKEASVISGGQHSLDELKTALQAESIALGRDVSGRECVTTADMMLLESKNSETLKTLAGSEFKAQTSKEEVNAFLERLEQTEGIKLSSGQADHVRNELAGTSGLSLTQGDPGTGKTYAAGIVERFNQEVLQPSGRGHQTLNVAFTGKAASEMAAASGGQAFTIDSFLLSFQNGKVEIEPGGQLVLKVDEASMVGARHAEKLLSVVQELQDQGQQVKLLLQGDSKQMQAIQAGDFYRQATEIARESGDYAALKEITRQKDPRLNEIARLLNRDGDEQQLAQNGREAIQELDSQGRVVLAKDRWELNKQTVDTYFEQYKKYDSVTIVTGTNRDRFDLNSAIRAKLCDSGTLRDSAAFSTLQSVNKTAGANSYNPGDKILFSTWGAPSGTLASVISVNQETNEVRAMYTYTDKKGDLKTITKNYKADILSQKTTAYEEQAREFAVNDKIIFLKNDKDLGVKNGMTGTILEADGEVGQLTIKTEAGETVEVDTKEYKHLDHGYAITIHKSQGQTVDSVIHHHNPLASMEASYQAVNVAVTRSRYEATIITTDIEKLEEHAGQVDEKETTLDREAVAHLSNLLQKTERENQQELTSPELKTETPELQTEQKTEQEAKREDQEQFIDQIEQEPEKESTQNDIELDL